MSDTVTAIRKRAQCFAAFAVMVETYDTLEERVQFIRVLRDRKIISDLSADLLLEAYGMEAA